MADSADRADQEIAASVAEAMREACKTPRMWPIGHCYFCDQTVERGLLFCDADCREDYEKEASAEIRRGSK
jgi:hypothetical protein